MFVLSFRLYSSTFHYRNEYFVKDKNIGNRKENQLKINQIPECIAKKGAIQINDGFQLFKIIKQGNIDNCQTTKQNTQHFENVFSHVFRFRGKQFSQLNEIKNEKTQ